MRSRLFAFVSVASMFLCLVFTFVALRGIWTFDRAAFGRLQVVSDAGRVSLTLTSAPASNSFWLRGPTWRAPWFLDVPGPMSTQVERGQFAFATGWYAVPYDQEYHGLAMGRLVPLIPYETDDWAPARKARYVTLGLPSWVPAFVTALLPAKWLPIAWRERRARARRRRRARARRLRGACPECGYDIRASQGRCPECGATISPPHDDAQRRGTAARVA